MKEVGQLYFKNAAVLVIGVGGLGCPAATYLAGAGIGRIGLVDGDVVETSNLHRQILHSSATVGMGKVASAVQRLKDTNPLVTYTSHNEPLTPQTAIEIISSYDLILDCTDHPTSRYLISDACILTQKPLVSASALRTDGQLTVLNSPPASPGDAHGGPCYRCVWPRPPPAEAVMSCGEGGILGPVVGVMGVLMAFEALKLIASGSHLTPKARVTSTETSLNQQSMLLFSGYGPRLFQSIKLPGRRSGCAACSADATIKPESLTSGSLDYTRFCGVTEPVKILTPEQRISAKAFAGQATNDASTLIDVREKVQFELCHLPQSINVPFSEIIAWKAVDEIDTKVKDLFEMRAGLRHDVQTPQNVSSEVNNGDLTSEAEHTSVTVICRLGNDSQIAVRKLLDILPFDAMRSIRDIEGGLMAWRRDVDPGWPDY